MVQSMLCLTRSIHLADFLPYVNKLSHTKNFLFSTFLQLARCKKFHEMNRQQISVLIMTVWHAYKHPVSQPSGLARKKVNKKESLLIVMRLTALESCFYVIVSDDDRVKARDFFARKLCNIVRSTTMLL